MYRGVPLALTLSRDSHIHVIGQCGNGQEAEKLFSSLRPDIALIDITVHAARGFTTAAHILALYPDARIIGLSTFFTHAYALRIVAFGRQRLFDQIHVVYPYIGSDPEGIRRRDLTCAMNCSNRIATYPGPGLLSDQRKKPSR